MKRQGRPQNQRHVQEPMCDIRLPFHLQDETVDTGNRPGGIVAGIPVQRHGIAGVNDGAGIGRDGDRPGGGRRCRGFGGLRESAAGLHAAETKDRPTPFKLSNHRKLPSAPGN